MNEIVNAGEVLFQFLLFNQFVGKMKAEDCWSMALKVWTWLPQVTWIWLFAVDSIPMLSESDWRIMSLNQRMGILDDPEETISASARIFISARMFLADISTLLFSSVRKSTCDNWFNRLCAPAFDCRPWIALSNSEESARNCTVIFTTLLLKLIIDEDYAGRSFNR